MAPVLYKKQKLILDYIRQHIESNGTAPTLREIADAIGVHSLSTVHEHLATLESKGFLSRNKHKTRSMDILVSDLIPAKPQGTTVPILGFIAAGAPLEPYTDPHAAMSIPPDLITGKKRVYVLQVRGESMIEDHIQDGDYVIIEQAESAQNGDVVVALLDNGMATLKRFYREATRVRLEPANSTMSPLFVKNVRIQGKMVGLIRKFLN